MQLSGAKEQIDEANAAFDNELKLRKSREQKLIKVEKDHSVL